MRFYTFVKVSRRIHTSRPAKSLERQGRVAWCLATRPGDLSRKRFFQRPADVFDFFGRDFHHTPPPTLIIIAGPSNSRYCVFEGPGIVMSKFPKMFEEDSISRIRGSWDDCDRGGEGGWVTKIAAEKIEPMFFIFSSTIYVTQFPPSQSQDTRICNIMSLMVPRLWWVNSQNVWRRLNMANSRILRWLQ